MVGSGKLRQPLEDLSRSLGVAADVHFEPATSEVARWLNAMDIFVLPSLSEALSNSLRFCPKTCCCSAGLMAADDLVLSVPTLSAGNICQTICKPGGHERYDVGLCFMRWRRRRRPVDGCRLPVFRLDDDGRIGFLCRFVAPENHVTYPGCVSGRITTLIGGIRPPPAARLSLTVARP